MTGSIDRKITKRIMVGNVPVGGGEPISVQSMLNVPASDIEGSVKQAVALEKAGCQIDRENENPAQNAAYHQLQNQLQRP